MHLFIRFLPFCLIAFSNLANTFEIYQLTSVSTSCSEFENGCSTCASVYTTPSTSNTASAIAPAGSSATSGLTQSCLGYGCQSITALSASSTITSISLITATATAEPTTISLTLESRTHTNTSSIASVTTSCISTKTVTEYPVPEISTGRSISSTTLIGAGITTSSLSSHGGQTSSALSTHGTTSTTVPSPSPYRGSAASLQLSSDVISVGLGLCILFQF